MLLMFMCCNRCKELLTNFSAWSIDLPPCTCIWLGPMEVVMPANKFCVDHEWVGTQDEQCPECEHVWGNWPQGFPPERSPTGRVLQPFNPEPHRLPKVTQMEFKAIQLQTTVLTGGGVVDVPQKEADGVATHWSIYLVGADGEKKWVTDYPCVDKKPSHTYTQAMVHAAKLSMEYGLPINPIK